MIKTSIVRPLNEKKQLSNSDSGIKTASFMVVHKL